MAKKKKKKETKKKFEYAAELYGVLFVLIAILGLGKYGPMGRFITSFFLFLFGSIYMVFIVALLVVGGYLIVKREWPDFFTTKLIGTYIFTLGLLVLMHCEFVANNDGNMMLIFKETVNQLVSGFNSIMKTGNLSDIFGVGGGIIGGVFAIVFDKLFSYTGMKIVAITLIALGFSLFIGFSLFDLLKEKWENRTPREKKVKEPKVKDEHKKVIINDGNEENANEEKEEGKKIKISNIAELTQVDNNVEEKTVEKTDKDEVKEKSVTKNPDYQLPSLDLLDKPKKKNKTTDNSIIEKNITTLEKVLEDFKIKGKVVEVHVGPTVVQYELEIASGTRVNKITSINREISLALAKKDVRIEAPIPGKNTVGIEFANDTPSPVSFYEIISSKKMVNAPDKKLMVPLGKSIMGDIGVCEINKMPHMLIAGTTGSGKSVCVNGIICSILMRAKPSEVKLVMVDPKVVELSVYNGIPHLLRPVVTEPKQAAIALQKMVEEMERRYQVFSDSKTKNIEGYNEYVEKWNKEHKNEEYEKEKLPYIVVIIDELADLMMVAAKEVEDSILRITQKARAAGIHLIVATQRPSTNVVTGLIKANITNRIAFNVASGIDSRVILDTPGAENLIGLGDLLLSKPELAKPQRIQGCFVSEDEIAAVVEKLKSQGEPDYHNDILKTNLITLGDSSPDGSGGTAHGSDDPLVWEAADIVVSAGVGSTSNLQRRLSVGYSRAGRIMDLLEAKGIVGPQNGSKPREVLVDALELETLKAFEEHDSQ